jgi:fatty-acid desaturase
MKNYKYLLTIFFPLHLLLVSLIFLVDFNIVSLIYFFSGYILIGGLGIEIGLHRWASHRSIKLKSLVEPFVIYMSLMSCQGHPIWWAAMHRGFHHKYSDTVKDEHSPILGKWNSFVGWILKHDLSNLNYKCSSYLIKDARMIITARYYETIIISSWLLFALIDINLLFWFFILPTFLSLHGEGLINTFCHLNSFGYRNFNTNDNSRNIPLLGLICWGNGWHNNHHKNPGSFDFGKSISNKQWEFDPCVLFYYIIKK